jgi:hypothetical protein
MLTMYLVLSKLPYLKMGLYKYHMLIGIVIYKKRWRQMEDFLRKDSGYKASRNDLGYSGSFSLPVGSH